MKRALVLLLAGSFTFLGCAHVGMHRSSSVCDSIPSPPEGFEPFPFSYEGETKNVYQRGSGPAVLILHEIYGLSPETFCLGRRIADAGFTVFLPHLFGRPGERGGNLGILPMCLGHDFNCLSGQSSPVTRWLRALVPEVVRRASSPKVGVIGMCLTGAFPLVILQDPAVKVAVLSQPSLPFALTPGRRWSLGVGQADLEQAKERSRSVRLLALRFYGDRISPEEKFATLADVFGTRIEIEEFPPRQRHQHAVLTFDHQPEALALVLQALRKDLEP